MRGGGLDQRSPYYARSANRAGAPPNFPPRTVEDMAAMIQHAPGAAAGTAQPQPQNFKS